MSSDVQTLRFRRPAAEQQVKPTVSARHTGILQDQLRRAQRRPWVPSFSLGIRILFFVRFCGAMYSNIDDCDEVYNFWEPLHFLDKGQGFQTWEVSPKYAIRSWAYILLHFPPARLAGILFGSDKRIAFFAVRISLAAISVFAEVSFFRAVVTKINERVGRYVFFMLLFSAGMWNASTAFLSSSFAMYLCTIAFSYVLAPATLSDNRRTIAATALFAAGGIVGWPFALALAIPFVFEELFISSADKVTPENKRSWMIQRWMRMMKSGLLSLLILVPIVAIDSAAFGELTVVPWNIIRYNIFGGSERGPDLYGTAPWNFYISNLILNFNILAPLALASLPALGLTYLIDRKRLGLYKYSENQSSPFTILALRLAPFYLWLAIFTLQPHKEERFMFPAYPLLCLNAAVSIYLMRGWVEVAYLKVTRSPYKASQSLIFRNFTFSIVLGSIIISISRIFALWHYYHAPLSVMHAFQSDELPRVLNASGLLPVYPPGTPEEDIPTIDLTPVHEFGFVLCLGKEWHRFPGHYLVPNGVRVDFIKSEFDGLLPRHFNTSTMLATSSYSKWWFRPQTSYIPDDLNDLNLEEKSHYVTIDKCDYLIDLDFPIHPVISKNEPRYSIEADTWERVQCAPFLDARHSLLLTRMFWVPGSFWQSQNEFGDYCLLRNAISVSRKEKEVAQRAKRGEVQF